MMMLLQDFSSKYSFTKLYQSSVLIVLAWWPSFQIGKLGQRLSSSLMIVEEASGEVPAKAP